MHHEYSSTCCQDARVREPFKSNVYVSSRFPRLHIFAFPLQSQPPGYALQLEEGQLDTQRFASLAARGRAALAADAASDAATVAPRDAGKNHDCKRGVGECRPGSGENLG